MSEQEVRWKLQTESNAEVRKRLQALEELNSIKPGGHKYRLKELEEAVIQLRERVKNLEPSKPENSI